MDRSLARYIWKHTWRHQLWILFIVAVSMIPYFMSFDLPKQIVNGPIQGKGFEQPGATQTFMSLGIDLPWLRLCQSVLRHSSSTAPACCLR